MRAAVMTVILALAIGLLSGCATWCRINGACPVPDEPQPIVVREPAEPCLAKEPPNNAVVLPKKPETCPPEFEACFTRDEIGALLSSLGAANAYASEAWQRCGTRPSPTP